ncbi:MAG: VOC family protein [Oscillospiraceae bacterium]|nr:VOC family protein [Oscillospiraceae bacterium]
MKAILNHAALNVRDFEWYLNFFEDVFGMKEEKRQGVMPYRKIWLDGGIQLNECQVEIDSEGPMDHLGFTADDVDAVIKEAKDRGCIAVPYKPTWFILPNGVVIEMKQL